MKATKFDQASPFSENQNSGQETQLSLATDAIRIRKNGIEFRSPTPIAAWTEMTVDLHSLSRRKKVKCTGVVVSCQGNRLQGYSVSMLFMNLTTQTQNLLTLLAYSH